MIMSIRLDGLNRDEPLVVGVLGHVSEGLE
jgi:hypothetical protein